MNTKKAYNNWSAQYDTNINKTRDMEAVALRKVLSTISFEIVLEIGCGTGKNTEWLMTKSSRMTCVDFSDKMLAKAKEKIKSPAVQFIQADIKADWTFGEDAYDLAVFSLVLEHIEQLDFIFAETAKALQAGGYVYIGELHPFKQYAGSKARFETEEGVEVLECYTHHISDFLLSAEKYGLELVELNEFFDDDDRTTIPRILALLLRKK